MGSRDHIMELARHLRQLKRLDGVLLCTHSSTPSAPLWLISDIPANPPDPKALLALLEQHAPAPQALQAALNAHELIELTPSRLARWSYALRCLNHCKSLERTIAQGHQALKAWRGKDLAELLKGWRARLEQLKLATARAHEPGPWRSRYIIGPWERCDEPAHIKAITQQAQPDHELWTKLGLYLERLAIIYGADAATNAWAWAQAAIRPQRHARAICAKKRALFLQLSQRLDQDQAEHHLELPAPLHALLATTPTSANFAHQVARAFNDYMGHTPERAHTSSVRALSRAIRAARCHTFESAAALCLERRPSTPLDTKDVQAHLILALHSPGKLKAPSGPLKDLEHHTEALETLVKTQQEHLWPYHINISKDQNTYIYQRLLEARPPIHLLDKLNTHKLMLTHELAPLFGRWRALGIMLEFMIRHKPVEAEDYKVLEHLTYGLRHADERMIYAASLYATKTQRSKSFEAWRSFELAMQVLPQHRALMARWDEPSAKLTLPDQLERHLALSRHSLQDWRRYVHYRVLCGHEATVSKNIISHLEQDHKHAKERAWLERTLAEDNHDEARYALLKQRLNKLIARDGEELVEAMRRMDNQMERACEQLARRSLELLLERALLTMLKLTPDKLAALKQDHIEALYLLSLLNDHELADAFIQAAITAAPPLELEPNARWARRAQDKGLELNAWMKGFDLTIEDNQGQRWRIHTEANRWERVLMGSAFNTCLALDSFNAPSAIINALDLNKHVIYVRDHQGQPVARKLIGLSSNLELVGYQLYTKPDASQHKHWELHIAEACASLATSCNAKLIDQGQPEQLQRGDLYDDGAIPWILTPSTPLVITLPKGWPSDASARQENMVSHHQAPRLPDWLWLNIHQAQRRQDGLPAHQDDLWTHIDEPGDLTQWVSTAPLSITTLQALSHTMLAHEEGQRALHRHLIQAAPRLEGYGLELKLTLQARSTAETIQLLKVLLRLDDGHGEYSDKDELAANLCPHLLWALAADPNWRLLVRELKRSQAPALRLASLVIMSELYVPGSSAPIKKLLHNNPKARALLEQAHNIQRSRPLTPPDEALLDALEAKEETLSLSVADYFHLSRIARAHRAPHPHRSRALGLLCTRSLHIQSLDKTRRGDLTPSRQLHPEELSAKHQLACFKGELNSPCLFEHELTLALPWLRALKTQEDQHEALDHHWRAWYRAERKNNRARDESAVTIARMTHNEPELASALLNVIIQDDHHERLKWMAATITATHYIGTSQALERWTQALIEELKRCPLHELYVIFKPKKMDPWGITLLETICEQRECWLDERRLAKLLKHLQGFGDDSRLSWMAQHLQKLRVHPNPSES